MLCYNIFVQTVAKVEDKSWFEKRREDNLRANAEFLASLQMSEVRESKYVVQNEK